MTVQENELDKVGKGGVLSMGEGGRRRKRHAALLDKDSVLCRGWIPIGARSWRETRVPIYSKPRILEFAK